MPNIEANFSGCIWLQKFVSSILWFHRAYTCSDNIEIYDSSGNSPLCEWSSILSSEKLHWALQVFFYILTVVGIQVMMYVIYDNFDSL